MSLVNTAVILAGGKSTRMGFDKQLIRVKDICIVDYLVEMLSPVFKNIIVVTNKPELYKDKNIAIAEDVYKGYGPIGGIHAGLSKSQSMYNYFIACDMPNINKCYIEYMIKRLEEDSFKSDAVITKKADWIEPFNAFYSKKLIPAIEDNIKKGKVRTMELLEISNVLYIDEAIARGFSPDWSMFANLNTREDLKGLV
ncbi:MAG: molybdenum cofactor guanylyltransferase [Clostridiaceae bacterium]|nr:molybdenum cofactor guanylyltransferase [Clostridiaceae bacterium]